MNFASQLWLKSTFLFNPAQLVFNGTLKSLLFYFLVSRIIFVVFAYVASILVPLREGYLGIQVAPDTAYLVWIWANFDGRHYIDIATQGYQNTNFAFFPLYSSILSLAGYLLPIEHIYIGIFLSSIFTLLAGLFIYKIAKIDFTEKVAVLAVVAYFFIPFSFFNHSVYTDSLFLLLATSSFYFARKSNWWFSGFLAGLAFLDRFSGIALIPALLAEWYIQNKGKNSLSLKNFVYTGFISIGLCILGFIAYLTYLQIFHGNFLLFQQTRSAWGEDKFVFPAQTVFRYLKIFLGLDKSLIEYYVAVLEFVSVIFYFFLTFTASKKIRLSYGIYMATLLIIIPSTGTFAGTPRYLLHLFPAFILFGLWMEKSKIRRDYYYSIFLLLGFILTALFTRGYFIT